MKKFAARLLLIAILPLAFSTCYNGLPGTESYRADYLLTGIRVFEVNDGSSTNNVAYSILRDWSYYENDDDYEYSYSYTDNGNNQQTYSKYSAQVSYREFRNNGMSTSVENYYLETESVSGYITTTISSSRNTTVQGSYHESGLASYINTDINDTTNTEMYYSNTGTTTVIPTATINQSYHVSYDIYEIDVSGRNEKNFRATLKSASYDISGNYYIDYKFIDNVLRETMTNSNGTISYAYYNLPDDSNITKKIPTFTIARTPDYYETCQLMDDSNNKLYIRINTYSVKDNKLTSQVEHRYERRRDVVGRGRGDSASESGGGNNYVPPRDEPAPVQQEPEEYPVNY